MLLERFALLCAIALSLAPANIAAAQGPPQSEASKVYIARLDDSALIPDRKGLGELLLNPRSAVEARANLDWLGIRFHRGESAFIANAYSRTLLAFAGQMPEREAVDLKGTALAALIYASAASSADGLQCADVSARANRAEQLASQLGGSGLLQLDDASRRKAAFIAVAIEQKTWSERRVRNDARFQCANGMAAISAGIAAGQAMERAPAKGEIGRQIAVTPPADFLYERRADADWWPEAEAVRARLPALVAKLAAIDHVPLGAELDALLAAE